MADIKISQLGAAIAVGDTDLVPIVSGGNTLKATAAQVKEHSIGNTNISSIGDGSVTGAISTLNTEKQPQTLATPLTIGGVSKTTVEAALGGLVSENQTLSTQSNSIAPTEDGANYSTSYIKGAQFYRNGVLYEVTASSVNSSTAINTGSGGNAKTADTVCAQLVSLSESETQTVAGITFKRIGESVVYYGNLTGLANTSYVNIGIAPFLPTEAYSIDNFYNSSAPYTPIGTIWINGSGGAMTIYKDSAKTSGYVSGSYICHL